MANIANLAVQLTANTGGFTGGLQKANSSLDRFKKQATSGMNSIDKAFAGIPSWGAGLMGIGSAGAIAAAGIYKVAEAFQRIDEIGDQAQMLGTTAETLSSLNFAANMMDAESFSGSIEKLSVNLGKAYHEAGGARDALHELGLNEKALIALPMDERLMAVADGMARLDTNEDKLRITTELFGKSGRDMVNMLGDGSAGMAAFIAEAKQFDIAVTEEDVTRIGEADAAMKRLTASTQALSNAVASDLAPTVAGFLDGLTEVMREDTSWKERLFDMAPGMNGIRTGVNVGTSTWRGALGYETSPSVESTGTPGYNAAGLEYVPEIPEEMLKESASLKDSVATAGEKFDAKMLRLNELLESKALDQETFNRKSKQYADELEKATRSVFEDMADSLRESVMTPLESFNAKMADLALLESLGEIDATTFDRAAKQYEDDLAQKQKDAARDPLADEGSKLFESMMTPVEKFNEQMANLSLLEQAGAIDSTTFDRAAAEYAKERDKDAIRAQEEKQDRIDAILEKSMTPLDEYRAGFEELSTLLDEGSILPEQYLKALAHLNETFEESDPILKERAQMQKQMEQDGKSLVDQTRNPFERFNADLESARQLLDEGMIDQDTFNRAVMASDQSNIQPLRDDYMGRMIDSLDAQLNDAQQRRDLLANTGEFRQVTNTSRLALGGGASDPQVRMLDVQTRQLAFLREIATQTRNNYAMAG